MIVHYVFMDEWLIMTFTLNALEVMALVI